MSKQEKRGRGKRPRDESTPSHGVVPGQGFSPINYPSQSSPTYPDTRFGRSSQSSQLESNAISGTGSSTKGQEPLGITSNAPPGKVAIPALKTPLTADSSKSFKKGRTPHACDYCRKAKAGCTGEQPCSRCKGAGVQCVYGDGKRDKEKKRLSKLNKETSALSQHNYDVTEALRRIRLDTALSTDDMRARIDDVLAMTPLPVSPDENEPPLLASNRPSPQPEEEEESDDQDADAEVGSTGSLDVINVDTDRDDTRATGHMGKSSSVAWANRTAEELEQSSRQRSGFALASYHTEDADIEYFDTSGIDPFDWPDSEVANKLVGIYFDHIHETFPILDKAVFMLRYHGFSRGARDLLKEDLIWLATFNVVFAIGAVYLHLTIDDKDRTRNLHHDHLIYFTRAKTLYLDQGLLYEDARIPTTCTLGLLSLYFLATCRLNRAWTICGLAIRDALTLGLHVRSEAKDLSDVEKEHRVRLWWSLYSLECSLNELTGRPSCISDRDISTPLPLNVDEDELVPGKSLYNEMEDVRQSGGSSRRNSAGSRGSRGSRSRPSATYQMPINVIQPLAYTFPVLSLPVADSTYFIYRIQLSIISHEIVTQLYCAATIKLKKWADVQDAISQIDRRLQVWRSNLPAEFGINFNIWDKLPKDEPYLLQRIGLAMLFNSARMILFRPCLCRFDGRIQKQSQKSIGFNQDAVETCVRSARTMISLLSWSSFGGPPDPAKLYAISPWWSTLHYLCEALSVLMLEMAFQAQHLPAEGAEILADAKRGLDWLRMMAGRSISAYKAWETFDILIRLVAPMIRWSVFDLPPNRPPQPLGYRRFSAPPQSHLNPDPNQQDSSEGNLEQFQAGQQWNPTLSEGFYSSSSGYGSLGYPQGGNEQMMRNPLDYNAAVERFSTIGGVHGHYDDPWQHMFVNNGGAGHGDMMQMQGQLGSSGQGLGYNVGFTGYEGYGTETQFPSENEAREEGQGEDRSEFEGRHFGF